MALILNPDRVVKVQKEHPLTDGLYVPEFARRPASIRTLDCFGFLHSDGRTESDPAVLEWDSETSAEPSRQEWYHHGARHRSYDDKDPETGRWQPAVIYHNFYMHHFSWYLMGRNINLDLGEDGKMLPCHTSVDTRTGVTDKKVYMSIDQTKTLTDSIATGNMFYKCTNHYDGRIWTREEFERLHTEMTEELLEWKAKWMESATKGASKNPQ